MKNIIFLPIDIDLSMLDFKHICDPHPSTKWNGYWNASFISEQAIKDNNLQVILDQLPFTKITRLFHKIQTRVVDSHIDCHSDMIYDEGEYEYLKNIEPGGYRLVISGNPKALWIFDNNEWRNVTLPSVPCCYVLNATAGYHRLDLDPGRETIYMRGYVDEIKHQDLLKRSLEKYKDYAVYFQ
jgi:hypothetical protein